MPPARKDLARKVADRIAARFAVGEIVPADPEPGRGWMPCRHYAFASASTEEVAAAVRELFKEIGF